MKIRNKITVYFSAAILLITGLAFLLIYFLYASNREEEFQMRQKEKITSTLQLLAQIKQTDKELVEDIDRLTINSLFDEKLLLFNDKKELIYSSLDDTPVPFSTILLSKLSAEENWVEAKDGLYDVVGTYVESNGRVYYGLSKAFDTVGYAKLGYLKNNEGRMLAPQYWAGLVIMGDSAPVMLQQKTSFGFMIFLSTVFVLLGSFFIIRRIKKQEKKLTGRKL